ncbi:MAG: 50S ribosomal protein L30 [Dysgonamonadaceae bacterium]|jgi:large subunit ribosomal protein L30|nr:50S ribosomal protein L30 [Dysgonamonadaceae bacterium]MDD4379223.1 50S ribosomal protein L30 [Dysgonamonadaceae bacterium]
MATIKIKQIKSRIGCPKTQKRTLDALGLRKMNQVVEHEDNEVIRGMIKRVHHLVTIVE